ncbi:MAG: heme ABC transporter ATP-binding protein [Pseudomonadota bacterium]
MLKAKQAGFSVNGKTLVYPTDIAIEPGRFISIVGPNGAGKSTLLGLLTGEREPTFGAVELDGLELRNWRPAELAARRAVVPQATELAFPFSVSEVVGLGATSLVGMAINCKTEIAIEAALARVGMADLRNRSYTSLSGGERQRTHLARALCQLETSPAPDDMRFLFLDEPTASLDLGHQLVLMDEVSRLKQEEHVGVLAVVHDLNLAARYSDEIILMASGRIVRRGAPAHAVDDLALSEAYHCRVRANTTPLDHAPYVLPQVCERGAA